MGKSRSRSWTMVLTLLVLTGCGGFSGRLPVGFTSRFAHRPLYLGKIAAHRSAVIASSPYVVNYPPAHRMIATISLLPAVSGSLYLINGRYVGSSTLLIPLGWHVTMHAVNNSTRPLRLAVLGPNRQVIKKIGPVAPHKSQSVSWTAPHHPQSDTFVWFVSSTANPIAGLPIQVESRSYGKFS